MAFIVTVPIGEQKDSLTPSVQHDAMGVPVCTAEGSGTWPISVQVQTSCIFPPSSPRAFNIRAKTGICNFFS